VIDVLFVKKLLVMNAWTRCMQCILILRDMYIYFNNVIVYGYIMLV